MPSRVPLAKQNIIGARLREARRNAQPRVSQADLSARVAAYGVRLDRAGISKIEHGLRTVTDYELLALAASLYLPVGWLIGEDLHYGSVADIPPFPPRRKA